MAPRVSDCLHFDQAKPKQSAYSNSRLVKIDSTAKVKSDRDVVYLLFLMSLWIIRNNRNLHEKYSTNSNLSHRGYRFVAKHIPSLVLPHRGYPIAIG